MKKLKEQIVDDDEILDNVDGIKENKTDKNLKKGYSYKIKKLEDALLIYICENDLKILKTEFPEKWNFQLKN